MRRRSVLIGVAVAVALCAGGVGFAAYASSTTAASAASDAAAVPAGETTKVVLGDLIDSKLFSGTLGYGTSRPLLAAAAGTLTSVPAPGQEIGLGEQLYAVDEQPVRAFHGAVPLYRTLEYGMEGADVQQLKDSLRVLGYAIPGTTNEFDSDTLDAVEAWQDANGLEETGRIGADQIAFVPGAIRVDRSAALVGAPAQGTVFDYTSTSRYVSADVDEVDVAKFAIGQQVDIGLRSGESLVGTVEDIGLDGREDGRSVLIALAEVPAGLAAGAQTVDVRVAGQVRQNVLTVPIAALTIDASGGYAVEVRDGSKRKLLPVTADAFAGGRAAISGDGIVEGLEVVVPS